MFFLHHCNVDRMLSLWAAINPGVWVSKGPAEGGTFTITGSASVDANSSMLNDPCTSYLVFTGTLALTPFWESQTTYWLPSQCTATGNFKYSYPEFNGLDLGNPNAVKAAIGNYINQQYGGGGASSLFRGGAPLSLFAQSAAGGAQAPAQGRSESQSTEAAPAVKSGASGIAHEFHSRGGNPHTAQKPQHGQEGDKTTYDWTVRIHFKKNELGGSFAVLIFLGQVPDDPSQWRTAPTFVGAHHAFVNSAASQCNNCRDQADSVSEGFVHLSSAIAQRSGLSSFDPSVVSPYLRENLHWRVQLVRIVFLCPVVDLAIPYALSVIL
jgi:tyrosinase